MTIKRQAHPEAKPKKSKLRRDDFAIYRDPVAFRTGAEEHTWMCRVLDSYESEVTLQDLKTRRIFREVDVAYVRKLSPERVMDDIDAAPLEFPGEMLSAGDAWLRLQRERGAGAKEG